MLNIFSEQYSSDTKDSELVASARQGDRPVRVWLSQTFHFRLNR